VPEARPVKKGLNVPEHPDQGLYDFLVTHRYAIVIAVVGALVVIVGVAGVRHLHAEREGRASSELEAARNEIDATKRLEALNGVLAKYPSSRSTRFALLEKAHTECELRQYEEALATAGSRALTEAAENAIVYRGKLLAAAASEGLGRFDDAQETYDAIVADGVEYFAQLAQSRLDALIEMMADAQRAARNRDGAPGEAPAAEPVTTEADEEPSDGTQAALSLDAPDSAEIDDPPAQDDETE